MEKQALLTADYLDIVFDNRNKAYGSYELRKHYGQRMQKAMYSVLFLCSGLIAMSFLKATPVPVDVHFDGGYTITDIAPPPPILPTKTKAPQAAATIKVNQSILVPVIEKDSKVDKPKDEPIKMAANPNAIPGDETRPGDGNSLVKVPGGDIPGTSTIVTPTAPPAPEKAVGFASEMPAFNGDIGGYLRRNLQYPDMARSNGIEGRVYVQFIVETDGSVTNVALKRGAQQSLDEEALRVVRSMPKWKPGKNNGKPVRVFLTLPIYFQLQ